MSYDFVRKVQLLDSSYSTVNPATEDTLKLVGKHKYQHAYKNSGAVTVDPSSTVDWLSVSGTGHFMLPFYVHSEGIAPNLSFQMVSLDGYVAPLAYIPDIYYANSLGLTSAGIHSLGARAVDVVTWDTTNNIYTLRHLSPACLVPFRDSLTCTLRNDDSANSATMQHTVEYAVFVASKRVLMHLSPHYAKNKSIDWVKARLSKANVSYSSVSYQLVGRWTEELSVEPEIQIYYEKSEGRVGRMYALIEVVVPDEVKTEQILAALSYAKLVKEEEV